MRRLALSNPSWQRANASEPAWKAHLLQNPVATSPYVLAALDPP